MKCNFCGNDLPQGADFCPECGMIISLGGTEEIKAETADVPEVTEAPEVPEFTPNVFRTMEIEEEVPVAAAELEADTAVETAPVIEAIPEYDESKEAYAEPEAYVQPEESVVEAPAVPEETFAPPEYKSELSYLDEKEEAPAADTSEAQAQALFGDDFISMAYSGDTIEVPAVVPEVEEAPAEEEDNSLIEALFDPSVYAASQDYEDITAAHNESIKKEKARTKNSNKGYAMVAALVVVLVGIIFAAGYVMDNILPKIQGNTTTTDSSVNASVPSSTLPTTTKPTTTVPSTVQPASSTTTTTNPSSTSATSTTASTTASTTTTTKPSSTTSTTSSTTTTQSSQSVSEPSSYNMDYVAYFPKNGSVTMRTKPASSAATVATQPYGYPLYAMASQNGYYYVDSPYHDLEGWVLASSLEKYEEETTSRTTTSTTTPTTKPSDSSTTSTTESSTSGTTGGSSSEGELVYYDSPYTATITDALNFRQGPGTGYSILTVVPYGYTVTVYGYSSSDNDWVYVEVTDSRYEQYGTAEGWVLSDYLS